MTMMIGIVNVHIRVPSVDIQQLKHINTQVKFKHLQTRHYAHV